MSREWEKELYGDNIGDDIMEAIDSARDRYDYLFYPGAYDKKKSSEIEEKKRNPFVPKNTPKTNHQLRVEGKIRWGH